MMTAITENTILDLVIRLRKPEQNELFEDVVKDAWGIFGFEGEPDLVAFEAFLIEAILNDVSSMKVGKDKKDPARRKDIALLTFGLLDGYYHTDIQPKGKFNVPFDTRRMKYLKTSDYLQLHDSGKYSVDDIDKDGPPWNTLIKFEGRYLARISKYLFKLVQKETCAQTMQAGIEKFTKTVILPDSTSGRQIVLPKPCYTLESFPHSSTKAKDDPDTVSDKEVSENVGQQVHPDGVDDALLRETDVIAPEELSVPSQEERQSNAKWYRILPASLSLICLIASVCLFVASHNNENVIQEISVAESEISLYPGGYERLQIWTYPEDADLDALECHSDSSPWITASKTNDWADVNPWTEAWNVTAENNWTEELPYTGKISVMGGKAIPVYVDVTVKTQEYKNDTGILNGTTNEFDDTGEENSDALVNP